MARKLKIGMIGCGNISALYTDIYAQLTDIAQIVATADIDPTRAASRAAGLTTAYSAEAFRQEAMMHNARTRGQNEAHDAARQSAEDARAAASNEIRTYDSHTALLKDPEIDAVLVLTNPPIRGVPVVAAAEAGKHVFSEGPMAKSVQEADEILAAVEKTGVTYVSQCGGRYTRGLAHARQAINSGLMGPLAVAKLEINWYQPQSYYTRWHGTFEGEGGGAIFHHGRYVIEPFLYALGSPVVEVTAYSGPFVRDIEIDSYTLALVRYANGAVGIIQGSLLHHSHPKTPSARMEFVGERASMVVFHEHTAPSFRTYPSGHPLPGAPAESILLETGASALFHHDVSFASTNTPEVVSKLESLVENVSELPEEPSQVSQSRLWVTCVLEGKPIPVPQSVGRQHAEFVRAVYKSAELGQSVQLPLDTEDPYYSFEGRLTRPDWMPELPA